MLLYIYALNKIKVSQERKVRRTKDCFQYIEFFFLKVTFLPIKVMKRIQCSENKCLQLRVTKNALT